MVTFPYEATRWGIAIVAEQNSRQVACRNTTGIGLTPGHDLLMRYLAASVSTNRRSPVTVVNAMIVNEVDCTEFFGFYIEGPGIYGEAQFRG